MDLIRYGYKGRLLAILQDNKGNPWWVANEVCELLDLGNPRSSLTALDSDERAVHSMDTLGGRQDVNIINEPGLYSLIFKSRKPEAKTFKRWVTHEVLPSIRKTGAYRHPDPGETGATRGRKRRHDPEDVYAGILKAQRQLHQIFEHAYKIARRMTASTREASLMAQAKVEELTGINLAESYRLPPGMKPQAETDRETVEAFINDCCLVGDVHQAGATEIYQAFRNWYRHNRSGETPTQKWFGGQMGRRFKRKKDGTYKYTGVGLGKSIPADEGYVRDFIDECCSLGEGFKASLQVVFDRFSDFHLKRTGRVPLPIDRFAQVLSSRFSIVPDADNILPGVRLMPVAQANA